MPSFPTDDSLLVRFLALPSLHASSHSYENCFTLLYNSLVIYHCTCACMTHKGIHTMVQVIKHYIIVEPYTVSMEFRVISIPSPSNPPPLLFLLDLVLMRGSLSPTSLLLNEPERLLRLCLGFTDGDGVYCWGLLFLSSEEESSVSDNSILRGW